MRLKFGEWLWSDAERRVQLERDYNEARNAYATAKFDGSFLGFEGMALSLGRAVQFARAPSQCDLARVGDAQIAERA